MTSKDKFNLIMKRKTLPFLAIIASSFLFAQTYSNGPLSTGTTSSDGTTAPTGYTWSELQAGNTNFGFGATNGNSLADDFTVPAGEKWTISSVDVFGFQDGTEQPFATCQIRIFGGGEPGAGGSVIFGDLTTNVKTSATDALTYRINNFPNTDRKIWKLTSTISKELSSGTYWLNFAAKAIDGSYAFFPAVTVVGQASPANANGKQYLGSSSTWKNLVDNGSGTAQAVPFILTYSVSTLGVNEVRQFDSRISIYPNPTADSFKIDLPNDVKKQVESVELYDFSGKIVKTFTASESYNVSNLSKGIYLVKIKTGNAIKALRLEIK